VFPGRIFSGTIENATGEDATTTPMLDEHRPSMLLVEIFLNPKCGSYRFHGLEVSDKKAESLVNVMRLYCSPRI
jgi:hypothetical protein